MNQAEPANRGQLSLKRLLIVEDDWLLQNLLANKLAPLREQGITVDIAFDGIEAFKLAQANRPDIILLDILLPGMTGFEFLETLQEQDPTFRQVPVIVFSNLNSDTDRERATALGVRVFMHKADSTLEEIVEKIEELVREGK